MHREQSAIQYIAIWYDIKSQTANSTDYFCDLATLPSGTQLNVTPTWHQIRIKLAMTAHQWLLFLPASLLVAASPGAGNFLALTNGARGGLGPAVAALFGRFSAFALLILMVTIGLGVVLKSSAIAFSALKWAGVFYLLWLGLRLWRSNTLPAAGSGDEPPTSWRILAKREFVVALTNPKAMLLFTAFLPQFVLPRQPMVPQLVALGSAYIAVEFMAASGYAFVGSRITNARLDQRRARQVNRLTGTMMMAAAGWLATMKRAG